MINDPAYADAILDRLVHNAHRVELDGESMRRPATTKHCVFLQFRKDIISAR
jgi:DNA replication protein DnaC